MVDSTTFCTLGFAWLAGRNATWAFASVSRTYFTVFGLAAGFRTSGGSFTILRLNILLRRLLYTVLRSNCDVTLTWPEILKMIDGVLFQPL